ncbi:hypothetical protein RDI58_028664 [Solanum bulbocastanum]|uniref:Uncharacterized protein n=1 Tax=Solanum bulbocastanum TaxID=147425 RepID=A0AAN8XZ85_SOLBU
MDWLEFLESSNP